MKLSEAQIAVAYTGAAKELLQVPPLKRKYMIQRSAKFNGQKRKTSNSGNVGRACRSRARCLLGPGRSRVL
jgi:hypothetical protein